MIVVVFVALVASSKALPAPCRVDEHILGTLAGRMDGHTYGLMDGSTVGFSLGLNQKKSSMRATLETWIPIKS